VTAAPEPLMEQMRSDTCVVAQDQRIGGIVLGAVKARTGRVRLGPGLRIVALSRLSRASGGVVAAVWVDPVGEDVRASAVSDLVGDVLEPCA